MAKPRQNPSSASNMTGLKMPTKSRGSDKSRGGSLASSTMFNGIKQSSTSNPSSSKPKESLSIGHNADPDNM